METISPKVAIIVLNWNGGKDTIDCMESLCRIKYSNFEVIVVDNGSTDDSIQRIRQFCNSKRKSIQKLVDRQSVNRLIRLVEITKQEAEDAVKTEIEEQFETLRPWERLKLITCERNYGFAEGCNIAIRHALLTTKPDYLLLLNNDVVVHEDFLTNLVEVSESDPKIGFAGSKTYFYEYGGRKDVINAIGAEMRMFTGRSIGIGFGEVDKGQYEVVREVGYAAGSCILVRADVVKTVGLLDSRFFTYWEETDWCFRGKEYGYKTVYAPGSRIWHKIGASAVREIQAYYSTRNAFWFMRKHASRLQYVSFLIFFLTRTFGYAGKLLICHDEATSKFMMQGVLDGLRGFDRKASVVP